MNGDPMDPGKRESPIDLAMEDIQKALVSLKETVENLASRTTQIRNLIPSKKDVEGAEPPPQPASTLTSKLRDYNNTINIQTAHLARILSELDI